MKLSRLPALVAILAAVPFAGAREAAAQAELSKDIIAVQIRKQGFECKNPQSATRDDEASKPDAEVWVLICEDVSYRVQLTPDMAANVEILADAPAETNPDPTPDQTP